MLQPVTQIAAGEVYELAHIVAKDGAQLVPHSRGAARQVLPLLIGIDVLVEDAGLHIRRHLQEGEDAAQESARISDQVIYAQLT